MSDLYNNIYDRVRMVPEGKVATYGQIARMVGCGPRTVGYAMAALKTSQVNDVPWHRVINSKGEISLRGSDGKNIQRQLLENEGILFNNKGRIDLNEFGWQGPLFIKE